jgi:hypothetical protein
MLGYFRQGTKCEQCTNTDETFFNYPTIPIVLGPICVVILYSLMWDQVDRWGSLINEFWALAFLVIIFLQILGLVVGTSVPWPSQIKGTLYAWEYFVDIPDMLRLACINNGDFHKFGESYTVRATSHLSCSLSPLQRKEFFRRKAKWTRYRSSFCGE